MTMLTNHNGPEFSEDPTSLYRRDLISTKTRDYMFAVTELHNHLNSGIGDYLQAMADYRHADLVAATLPRSAERDEWKIRAQDAYFEAQALREAQA